MKKYIQYIRKTWENNPLFLLTIKGIAEFSAYIWGVYATMQVKEHPVGMVFSMFIVLFLYCATKWIDYLISLFQKQEECKKHE